MKIISKTEATKHVSSCFINIITFPNNFNFYEVNSRHNIIFISNDGEKWKQCQTLFFGAPKSLQMVTAAMKLKDAYSLEGKL